MSDQDARGDDDEAPLSAFHLGALVAGPLVSFLLLLLPPPAAMPAEAWRLVALAAWMIVWWLSEAVPIPTTALLPLVLMPLYAVREIDDVAPSYADPLIFLFLGGFMLAAAMQRSGLHRRIALGIIARVGTGPDRIILGFMLATAFLSMWVSNTATAIMMYTVGLSVIGFVERETKDAALVRRFGVALMLGIAYSASIGGVGTLIGTPPNALLASFLADSYDIEVGFFTWMLFGVPIVCVMLPAAWLLLTRALFPARTIEIGDASGVVARELEALGAMSPAEKVVAVVFAGAALGWIFRVPLADATGLPLDDTMIALIAAILLFALPVSRTRGAFALNWAAAVRIPWGVLLLFGGGLALAGAFKATGLAQWIGEAVAGFDVSTLVLILLVTAAIVYLTEITSNTASTATFLPILGAIAVGLGLDPRLLVVPVAVGASMAFMMPVATPPNAIVFAYAPLTITDMVRAGFWLNILAIAVVFAAMYLLAGPVFGLRTGG